MKLERLTESDEYLNELFGRKKKVAKKSAGKSGGAAASNVQRDAFNDQSVKKWLNQSRYTGKDLTAAFQGTIETAKVTLNGRGGTSIGIAYYRTKTANSLVVAKNPGRGDHVSDLWVKHDRFSGEPDMVRIFDAFLKCEDMPDVDALLKKYKFTNHKVY